MANTEDVIEEWVRLVKLGTHEFVYMWHGYTYSSLTHLPLKAKVEDIQISLIKKSEGKP
jgi:hypothetical protein